MSFSNYSFTGISLEADHCQSSEEVLAVAVAGLWEFQVQCIHYDLNFESRCSQSKMSFDKKHKKKGQKGKKNFKRENPSCFKERQWDITHKESSQALNSDLKKKTNRNSTKTPQKHESETDVD